MQAGAMRKRIAFQTRITTVDSSGGQSTDWVTVATVWAEVAPTGGKEMLASGDVRSNTLYTITTRYRPGITPRNRILYGSLVLDVVNVNDTDERHRTLVITASEGLNRG